MATIHDGSEVNEHDAIDIEDDDDAAEIAPQERKPGEPPREEKRRNRYREAQEAEKRATDRAAELERQNAEMRQQMLQTNQMMQEQIRRQNQSTEYDPIDYALEENFKKRQLLDQRYQLKQRDITPDELGKMQREAQQLEDERAAIVTHRTIRQVPQPNPVEQQLNAYAAANHPDILNSQPATVFFQGEVRRLAAKKAMSGSQIDMEDIKSAFDTTERELKIGRYRNGGGVDPGLQARLSGNGRGANAAPGNSGVGTRVNMDSHNGRYRAMADAAFGHIKDPQKRYERWARGPGKRLLQSGVKLDE